VNVQCGAFRNKLAVYYSGGIGGVSTLSSTRDFCNLAFFWWTVSFHANSKLSFQDRIENTNFPSQVTIFLQHVTILVNKLDETVTPFITMLPLFSR
jgi:hypothetical protein